LAQNHGVSRKFLYQQAAKASDAIDEAFEPSAKNNEVLFYLPVTKNWIRQFVLALILICHSSFRGVIEILNALFDYHHLSLGSVHNIVRETKPLGACTCWIWPTKGFIPMYCFSQNWTFPEI